MNEQNKTNNPSADGEAGSPQSNAAEIINSEESSQPPTQKQLAEVKNDLSAFERATLRWTRTTAGIGLVTAAFICLQWCEMHSGGVDTHNLAESTLAASRAWVVVQGTGFGFTKDQNFPFGRVVLADSGESPAFGIDGWRCVEVRSIEPPMQNEELQKSPSATCLPVSGGTLGKGVPITMDAFIPAQIPANFSKDTEGDGPHFYYWGIVTYDIYPSDGKRHSTSFCLKNGGDQLSGCREGGYEAN